MTGDKAFLKSVYVLSKGLDAKVQVLMSAYALRSDTYKNLLDIFYELADPDSETNYQLIKKQIKKIAKETF